MSTMRTIWSTGILAGLALLTWVLLTDAGEPPTPGRDAHSPPATRTGPATPTTSRPDPPAGTDHKELPPPARATANRLVGRVVAQATGDPIARAWVWVVGRDNGRPDSARRWPTFMAPREGREDLARTDDNGCFFLEPQTPYPLTLAAAATGMTQGRVTVTSPLPHPVIRLRRPAGSMSLLVVDDRTGSPLEGAKVSCSAIVTPGDRSWLPPPTNAGQDTGADGKATITGLDPGTLYTVSVRHDRYHPFGTPKGLRPGPEFQRIAMTPLPMIHLQVDWQEERERWEAEKRLWFTIEPLDGASQWQTRDTPTTVEIRYPGIIKLPAPTTGRFRLALRLVRLPRPGHTDGPALVGVTAPFRVSDQEEISLQVTLESALSLTGRIIPRPLVPTPGSNRTPTGLAGISIIFPSHQIRRSRKHPDLDGTFLLSPLAGRTGRILVQRKGVAALLVPFDIPSDRTAAELPPITLPASTGSISGTFHDELDRPLERALIVMEIRDWPHHRWRTGTDSEGRFTLAGLPWGSWKIHAYPPGATPPLAMGGEIPLAAVILDPRTPTHRVRLQRPRKD